MCGSECLGVSVCERESEYMDVGLVCESEGEDDFVQVNVSE